jgi:hypothetical protein
MSAERLTTTGQGPARTSVFCRHLGVPGARTLPLTVRAATVVPGRPSPVTGGVPFPRGELAVTDRVRFFDQGGAELPLQTEVLATWEADRRSVQWLLLDFQAAAEQLRADRAAAMGLAPGPTPSTTRTPATTSMGSPAGGTRPGPGRRRSRACAERNSER